MDVYNSLAVRRSQLSNQDIFQMTDTAQSPLDVINAQIAAARAGATAQATTNQVAPAQAAAAPAAYAAPVGGRPVTLGELLAQGGLRVDKYLKVDKVGFMIGTDEKNTYEELEVEFNLGDVVPFWGLRYGSSPAKYLRSTDRQVESRSKKPWGQCVAEAQQADSRCRGDYPSCDIPFTMVTDIIAEKGDEKGKALIEAGQTLGLTLSITNFKDFAAFIKPYDDLKAVGAIPANLRLRGKLVHKVREGGGNKYGAALFVDFVVVGDESVAAATAVGSED
jgi:hypothetical protein